MKTINFILSIRDKDPQSMVGSFFIYTIIFNLSGVVLYIFDDI